jgi:hypothetical protein
MTFETTTVPSETEIEPWVDAACALWDDATLYRRIAGQARSLAEARYGEARSRARHVDYFTSLVSGGRSAAGGRPWDDPVSGGDVAS